MDFGIEGKTALVTGGSSGLGLGCAQALAAEGVRICLVSRNPDKLATASATIPGASTLVCDITDPAALASMMDAAEAELGQVDILIANGGGPPPGNFESTDLDAYSDALALNMLPMIAMCKRLIPPMQSRGWGRVVAITSISVREPIDTLILSNTARAGLTSFLKTTSREVAGDGVTVNSLQPGLHLTERLGSVYDDPAPVAATMPTGTIGDPADFGRFAAFLCSDSAKFVTGASIPVDGGNSRGLQ